MLNTEPEIWKTIPNYEGLYEVSSYGRVRNPRKLLRFYTINSGYLALKLVKNKQRISPLVHQLVARSFCSNPNNYVEVNHIDGNKQNNRYANLEWCTSSFNKQHAIAAGYYDSIFTMKNSLGKKHLKNTLSKYHNVTYDRNRQKWAACIRVDGKNLHQRRFDTEEQAALHVNHIIDLLNLTDRPKNVIGSKPNDYRCNASRTQANGVRNGYTPHSGV